MLRYSVPGPEDILSDASSYEGMMLHPGIAIYHDEALAEQLAAVGNSPSDLANFVRQNVKQVFPGIFHDDLEFFGSTDTAYEEYDNWHIDPYGVAASLCTTGLVKISLTQVELPEDIVNVCSATNPAGFEKAARTRINEQIAETPPEDNHTHTVVSRPGTYVKFNGGFKARSDSAKIHVHKFNSLETPRASATGFSIQSGPILQSIANSLEYAGT